MPYLQRAFVKEDKVSLLALVVRPPAVDGVKPKVMELTPSRPSRS